MKHPSFGTIKSPRKDFVWLGVSRLGLALRAIGVCVLVLTALQTRTALAQNTNATIRGEIVDPSGAAIPKAQVLIVNQDTGVTVFKGASDSAGTFVAPEVAPGTYQVSVTATGLKQSVIRDLRATVAQVTSVNVSLQLGDVTETVTVESKGEQLDSTTSDISTLISPSDVQNLPLEQRTTENLLAFIPGVTHGEQPTK